MHLYEIRGLNFKILKLFVETSEPNGIKNLAIQNRVLQRDRVLQRRVLESDYCTTIVTERGIGGEVSHILTNQKL